MAERGGELRKGIVESFLGDGGERAVAGAENRLGGEGENAVAQAVQSLWPRVRRTAHGAREEGVAGEGEGMLEAGEHEGRSACCVAAGAQSSHPQRADGKFRAVGKWRGGGEGFAGADKCGGAGFFHQLVEVGNVVAVNVGEEDLADIRSSGEHPGAIRAGVECRCFVCGGIDDEVAIHRHVAEAGGKPVEPPDGRNGSGMPGAGGAGEEGCGAEIQFRSQFADVLLLRGEGGGGKAEAAAGFGDDVRKIVLKCGWVLGFHFEIANFCCCVRRRQGGECAQSAGLVAQRRMFQCEGMSDLLTMHKMLFKAVNDRLDLVADHAWRDRDPAGHLEGLKAAAGRLDQLVRNLPGDTDPMLRHFLEKQSYTKARDWLGEAVR